MDVFMAVATGDILVTHGVILAIGDLDGAILDTGVAVTDIATTTMHITMAEEDLRLTMAEETMLQTEITLHEDIPAETIQTEATPTEAIQIEEITPLIEITLTEATAILTIEEMAL